MRDPLPPDPLDLLALFKPKVVLAVCFTIPLLSLVSFVFFLGSIDHNYNAIQIAAALLIQFIAVSISFPPSLDKWVDAMMSHSIRPTARDEMRFLLVLMCVISAVMAVVATAVTVLEN